MSTKHSPATQIPWSAFPKSWPYAVIERTHQDRAYAVHAANAYGGLVALAYNIATVDEHARINRHWLKGAVAHARALLRELGEE